VQAHTVAAAMQALGIEVVITSPFRRCLQTSAEIVAAMGLSQGAWIVDWGLSEVGGHTAHSLPLPALLPAWWRPGRP
jgi:broad specificity phosphatase PhoE